MWRKITSLNIIDSHGINLIKEIHTDRDNEISVNASKDGKLILISLTTLQNNNESVGVVYVLSKVDDYYIIDGTLDPDDDNISRTYGSTTAIYESNGEYIIAVSDSEYKGSDGYSKVGGVFLFKFIPTKKWICIKTITKLDGDNERNYHNVGKCLLFTDNGSLILTADNKDHTELFLYETENFKQFTEYKISNDIKFTALGTMKVVDDILYINTTRTVDDSYISEIYYCNLNTFNLKLYKLVGFTYKDMYIKIIDFHRYDNKFLLVILDMIGSSTSCLSFDLYDVMSVKNRLEIFSKDNASLTFNYSLYSSKDSRMCLNFKDNNIFISYLNSLSKNKFNNIINKYDISGNLSKINNNDFETVYKKNDILNTDNKRALIFIKMNNLVSISNNSIFFLDRENDLNDKAVYCLKAIN